MIKPTTRNAFTLIESLACHPKPWRRKARSAFTLIELLVVIAIMSLLTALPAPGLPSLVGESSPAPTAKEIPPKEVANLFPNPSFEDSTDTAGPGKVTVGWLGKPVWDRSGAKAHTGKVAAGLSGDVGLHCGAKAEAGKRYRLSGYFCSDFDGVAVRIQINWLKKDGLIRYELKGPRCLTEYEPQEIVATAPPETVGVTLIITGSSEDDLVWMDDVFWGEVPEGGVTGTEEPKKTPGP